MIASARSSSARAVRTLSRAGRRRLCRAVAVAVGIAVVATGTTSAHEEYVVDEEGDVGLAEFWADALADPLVVGPLLGGAVVVLAVVAGYFVFRPFQRDIAAFRLAMAEYREYVPWLLRISVGIPLIGAGFGGYFISPAVEVELRLLQVALGFLLLFGLATRVVALAGLVAYLVALVARPALLLQLEFVGAFAAIVLLGSGRPSADHVFQRVAGTPGSVYSRFDPVYERARAFQARIDPYERLLPTILRVGLGAAFVYLGFGQKLLRPGLPLAVVERYDLTAVVPVPPELWAIGAGLAETTLGLALLVGVFTRATATTAIGVFTLTLFALPDDPVLAHVTLFGMASAVLIAGSGPYAVDTWLERLESDADADAERADATPAEPVDAP